VAGVNILLIDDEQRLLDALAVAFRFRWPDADILTATDAETGLGLALARAPDLVVLDVGLPDRSGFDVLADLRRASDVPVIMLGSDGGDGGETRARTLGASLYLAQPFSTRALIASAARLSPVADRRPRAAARCKARAGRRRPRP
jgi:DNA-binding response OmpR family regulator